MLALARTWISCFRVQPAYPMLSSFMLLILRFMAARSSGVPPILVVMLPYPEEWAGVPFYVHKYSGEVVTSIR